MDAKRERAAIEKLRTLCMGFPEANERVSHGEPTWFAGKGKVFAMLANHHHGSPHLAVWLPQTPDGQLTLLELDPQRYFKPPYVGPRGWVGVVLDDTTDWSELGALVRDAYVHVATAKLRRALAARDGAATR